MAGISRAGGWLKGSIVMFWLAGQFTGPTLAQTLPPIIKRPPRLTVSDLAVVVNDSDSLSTSIGAYYAQRRQVPKNQVLHVRFPPGTDVMPREVFAAVRHEMQAQMPTGVEALLLTWMRPWRVDCMSITTAFAFGFDEAFCAEGCRTTRPSNYYNVNSHTPWEEFQMRPTMSLAANSLENAKALIDRGVEADHNLTTGAAYLVETSDHARSVRATLFPEIAKAFAGLLPVHHIKADYIADKRDVMFYFTGMLNVPKVASNTYLPGAIADHLTSAGGVLVGGNQMSSMAWLEAGATASYGAVVEPCNFTGKFPNPAVVMARYFQGESLIESYWKSVSMPGQGIFIGEPLAAPYAK